nr:phospholipase-like protein [Tanacetum cinerariifolium]
DDGNVYCCDDNGDVPLFFMPAKPHYKYIYSSKQKDQIIREAMLNKIAEEGKQRKCLGHMNSSAHMRAVVGRYKFTWCNDITVDRSFWNGLCTLNDNHKGWLLDEYTDLWATYLWLTQQTDMDWAMMRDCLEGKIHVVLKETDVFEKKNIDAAKYKISFKVADGVPKSVGSLAIAVLANGIPLALDDPL